MDLSFLMVFSKKNIDPTGRQNFGDAPGQIPKLILTLCPKEELELLFKMSTTTKILMYFCLARIFYYKLLSKVAEKQKDIGIAFLNVL